MKMLPVANKDSIIWPLLFPSFISSHSALQPLTSLPFREFTVFPSSGKSLHILFLLLGVLSPHPLCLHRLLLSLSTSVERYLPRRTIPPKTAPLCHPISSGTECLSVQLSPLHLKAPNIGNVKQTLSNSVFALEASTCQEEEYLAAHLESCFHCHLHTSSCPFNPPPPQKKATVGEIVSHTALYYRF